ncbi:MAG: hypothetical protein P8Z79_24980 [Sedimentisphaerales bacterium]
MMKKLLYVSVLLLVSGSLSCKSWFSPKKPKTSESKVSASDFLRDQFQQQPVVMPPAETVPTNITAPTAREARPAIGGSEMTAVTEAGSSVISRTYPWPECGIVRLDKSMPTEIGLNSPFEYTITLENLTETTLNGIVVNEEVPEHFKFQGASPPPDREDGNKLIWDIPSLGPKANTQLRITGMGTHVEALKHCTTVITPVIPACTSVQVIQPELQLTKTSPPDVLLCDVIPVRYVVTNTGTGSVRNVKVSESLPGGLRTTDGKDEVIFDAGTLMAGQSRQFSAELRATKTGKYISKAVATSTTGTRAESPRTTTTVGLPILSIKKTGMETQYIGRPITYEITLANKSDVPAKNTILEDIIPSGVTGVKATSGAKLSGSKLVWEFGTLAPDMTKTVKVSYTPSRAGTLASTATASAYCAEAVASSVRTTVTGISALSLEVVDVEDPVRVGSNATYIIRVENQGSATATNIRVSCMLEDYVRYVSSAGATPGAQEGQSVRFLPLATLAPKAKAAWRVVVEAVRPGDARFKAVMHADQLSRPVEETESTHLYE